MKGERITVCVFGPKGEYKWQSPAAPSFEEMDYTIVQYDRDDMLNEAIRIWNPHIFITFGPWQNYRTLSAAPYDVRRRWIDASGKTHDDVGQSIMARYMEIALVKPTDNPKVSIFTAACNSGDKIFKPLRSIMDQTYKNLEWVIVDDSPTDENFKHIESLAAFEPRIKVFKPNTRSGRIGEVKRRACGLCTGDILVEMDHDDELTLTCIESIVLGLKSNPEAGFAYTDCSEVYETGENFEYPAGWALGFGSYRDESYRGKVYKVTNYPAVNAKTMRHIVGTPNHVRAWKRSVYEKIGGHNPDIHVADDYELMIRTFLYTRMLQIKRFGYIQYRHAHNNTNIRNREIQRLVRYFKEYYDLAIHTRCLQLGDKDACWTSGNYSNLDLGHPSEFPPLSLTYV